MVDWDHPWVQYQDHPMVRVRDPSRWGIRTTHGYRVGTLIKYGTRTTMSRVSALSGGRGTRTLKHGSGTTSTCRTKPQTHKWVLASSLPIFPRPKTLPFPPSSFPCCGFMQKFNIVNKSSSVLQNSPKAKHPSLLFSSLIASFAVFSL